jgi:glycosyltransferase involved in cell wall biosynthesis
MRVVHLAVAGDIGGAERLLVDLAQQEDLTGASHHVLLLTPNPRLRDYFAAQGVSLTYRAAREHPLTFLRQSLLERDARWVADQCRTAGADLLHLHTLGSHVLGVRAARLAKIPTVRTEHHFAYYTDWSARPFARWALLRTNRIVAISEFIAQRVLGMFPWAAPRMVTVRNGVNATRFVPSRNAVAGERHGPLRALIACRLEPWKGVDLAVRAMAQLEARRPGAMRLTIAGEGSQRPSLETLVRQLGLARAIDFVGRRQDMPATFAECELSVSASEEEPLGLSVLESMACARPVVAFREGGIPELLRDGDTGFFATAHSASALADALERAIDARDELVAMGRRARAFVEREGNLEAMCEGYREVYREVRGLPPL